MQQGKPTHSALYYRIRRKQPQIVDMAKGATSSAYVLGVGMTKFLKPRGKVDYTELGFEVAMGHSQL